MRHFFWLFTFTAALSACLEGGANNGGNQPGNKEGGTNVAFGEIAVDTGGRWFLSKNGSTLVVGDLESYSMRPLLAPAPYLVSFWPDGGGVYVLSLSPDGKNDFTNDSEVLLSIDLETEEIEWQRTLPRQDFRLDITRDGSRLIASDLASVQILDAKTGDSIELVEIEEGINDVDIAPSDDRIVVTHQTKRDEELNAFTTISVRSLADGASLCEVTAPNCASELVITRDGARAFLAPTFCGRDPVSAIDLEGCKFEQNLPGFGPVALSPSGETVVAFIDKMTDDPMAPARPPEVEASPVRYHLMFIDVETLEYETAPLGEVLPRYAFTPDGRTLVIDTTLDEPQPIVLLDVEAKTVRTVSGPKIELNDYVLTPDAQHAFVADLGLYDIALSDAVASSIAVDFIPISLNITPDGSMLLLKDGNGEDVHLFDIGTSRVSGLVECGGACS